MNPAEEYILRQAPNLQAILMYVRSVIFETIPKVEEKYRYKIPFYFYKGKPLCYLTVLKGKHFVDVGFWAGVYLIKSEPFLVKRKRKMMYSLEYTTLEDIDTNILKKVLLEAKAFNENKSK